jgi:two-component system response regulator FixJ
VRMADIARHHIFFVDDELEVCKAVSETLEESGYEVSHFTRTTDCLEQLHSVTCHLLITDLKMPKMNGIELLTEAKRLAPWMPVLVITGYGDIPTAVTAVKAGAADFIEKPLDRDSFLSKVASILQRSPRVGFDVGKPLTDREKRILKLVTEGKGNRCIAPI